jgi:hypothetical protein
MTRIAQLMTQIIVGLTLIQRRHRRAGERGDVPGWVMITVMTAGLVAALWAVAGPELERMLRNALNSVG